MSAIHRRPWALLACAILLAGSPLGHATLLWAHLAVEHHEPAHARGGERHAHPHRPAAANEPHEHDGVVHTHEQSPVDDAATPPDAISRYYLLPLPLPSLPAAAGRAWSAGRDAGPARVALHIDTPPPRPGA